MSFLGMGEDFLGLLLSPPFVLFMVLSGRYSGDCQSCTGSGVSFSMQIEL